MPKLIENVLIGGRVRLAGEDVSEADAKGVRPEAFAAEEVLAADEPQSEPNGQEGNSPEGPDAAEEVPAADVSERPATEEEPEKPTGGRGKRTSTK